MSVAARIQEFESIPPAAEVTVEDAYESVRELLDPGVEYEIDWSRREPLDTSIFQRFTRDLPYEAWLIARPLGGGPIVVCAVLGSGFPSADDEREFVERLAALKAADGSA